jgi:hypothetical protein
MRKFFALSIFVTFCLFARAQQTPVTDLGAGLSYLRVHSLPLDITSVTGASSQALIVDLRRVDTKDTGAQALVEALTPRAATTQFFLLVGPSTPRDLAKAISSASTKFLTLGIAQTKPDPRVEVQGTPAADRAAYDAFETGTPIEKLITGKIEKDRYDEATLVEEFKNGHVASPPEDDIETKPVVETKKDPAPATDRVLQRAVHLHRSLQALKR